MRTNCLGHLTFTVQFHFIFNHHYQTLTEGYKTMANGEEKKYQQNGKTIKIIPIKKVKKTDASGSSREDENPEKTSTRKPARKQVDKSLPKYAVGDKVSLKHIPPQYANAGFAESVIIKVFKSTHDQMYRYSIRSLSGQELALLKDDQIKPRK
jgi:hypothetical protein